VSEVILPLGPATSHQLESALSGELNAAGLPLNVSSLAYGNSLVVKSGPGVCYGFSVYSSNASAQWIQLFDQQGGTIASGAVPVFIATVAATSNLGVYFGPMGRYFQQGIVIGNSTTGPTSTAGSADTWFDVQYW